MCSKGLEGSQLLCDLAARDVPLASQQDDTACCIVDKALGFGTEHQQMLLGVWQRAEVQHALRVCIPLRAPYLVSPRCPYRVTLSQCKVTLSKQRDFPSSQGCTVEGELPVT